MVQRAATGSISGVFEVLIAICAVLYGLCTVFTTAVVGQLNFTDLTKENFTSGPMLVFLAVEIAYAGVWLAFAAVWLAWYAAILDWARARGAVVPSTLAAIGLWFVPGVNLGHPLVTLRAVRQQTGVKTPLDWWWVLFVGSLVLSTFSGLGGTPTGLSPVLVVATAAELVAVVLCWMIVRDFRRADQAWDPRGAMSLRDGAA